MLLKQSQSSQFLALYAYRDLFVARPAVEVKRRLNGERQFVIARLDVPPFFGFTDRVNGRL
jgi:hypothetical protein